jgi:SAM-dependent methyltransferase
MNAERTPPAISRVDVQTFEEMYRDGGDPWQFATSFYEQRRYDLIAAMLPRLRYRRAFEPGAAIGELTRRLALRCDEVVAVEASASAAHRAEQLLGGKYPAARVVRETIPDWMPTGSFDLIVMSEFGYYFDRASLEILVARLVELLDAGGTFVAAHWRGHSVDHLLHGDEVHEATRQVLGHRLGEPMCQYIEPDVRIDVWGTSS